LRVPTGELGDKIREVFACSFIHHIMHGFIIISYHFHTIYPEILEFVPSLLIL